MPKNDFLPEDYLEKRTQQRTNILCLVLLAVVMGAVAGAFFWTDRERRHVHNLRETVNAEFARRAQQIELAQQLHKQKHQMIDKAKITLVLVERVPRRLLLSELVNSMPTNLSLTELTLETKRLQAPTNTAKTAMQDARARLKKAGVEDSDQPQVPQTEVTMGLKGLAPTDVEVSQFMATLNRNNLFDNVGLAFSEEVLVDDTVLRRFQIELTVNQDVDVAAIEPKMVRRGLANDPMDPTYQITPDGRITAAPTDTP